MTELCADELRNALNKMQTCQFCGKKCTKTFVFRIAIYRPDVLCGADCHVEIEDEIYHCHKKCAMLWLAVIKEAIKTAPKKTEKTETKKMRTVKSFHKPKP